MKEYYFTVLVFERDIMQIRFKLKDIYSISSFKLSLIEHETPLLSTNLNQNEVELNIDFEDNKNGYIMLKATYTVHNSSIKYFTYKLVPQQYIDSISINVIKLYPQGFTLILLVIPIIFCLCCSIVYITVWPKHPYLTEYVGASSKSNSDKIQNKNMTPLNSSNV